MLFPSFVCLVTRKIVSTGDDEENAFNFNEENLESILSKIPPNTKVAVLSVVGAFRTGKVIECLFPTQSLTHPFTHSLTMALWLTWLCLFCVFL